MLNWFWEIFVVLWTEKVNKRWFKKEKRGTLWRGAQTFPTFSPHEQENTFPPYYFFLYFFSFQCWIWPRMSDCRFQHEVGKVLRRRRFSKAVQLPACLPDTCDGAHWCLCAVWWFSQAVLIQNDLKGTNPRGEHLIISKFPGVYPCLR